ncbi:MAG TPA: hypothetical protein VKV29_11615 [Chthonomonas sp.]|jgi:hypothetical protein|nr:hypothetical protein [Chthonomonas sp.]HLH80914.1 hypothetical protein [Chthonomonas sp.]
MTRPTVRSLEIRLAIVATAALFSWQMGLEAPLIALGQVRVSPTPHKPQ